MVDRICSKCKLEGNQSKIAIHHKDGNHNNNVITNLMYLCDSCHVCWHYGKWTYQECGLSDVHLSEADLQYEASSKIDYRIRLRDDVNTALENYIKEHMPKISGVPGAKMRKDDVASEVVMNFLAEKGYYPIAERD
jgi:hypothetical protein